GLLLGGVGVVVGAHRVQGRGDLHRAAGGRALEEQVLQEVRGAGVRVVLVPGAGGGGDAEGRRAQPGDLLGDHPQPARQHRAADQAGPFARLQQGDGGTGVLLGGGGGRAQFHPSHDRLGRPGAGPLRRGGVRPRVPFYRPRSAGRESRPRPCAKTRGGRTPEAAAAPVPAGEDQVFPRLRAPRLRRRRRGAGAPSPSSAASSAGFFSAAASSEPESLSSLAASASTTSTGTRESLPRSSTSRISTWIFSPMLTTSSRFSMRWPPCSLRICEMCSRPSLPGSSETNAPNAVVFTTVPR